MADDDLLSFDPSLKKKKKKKKTPFDAEGATFGVEEPPKEDEEETTEQTSEPTAQSTDKIDDDLSMDFSLGMKKKKKKKKTFDMEEVSEPVPEVKDTDEAEGAIEQTDALDSTDFDLNLPMKKKKRKKKKDVEEALQDQADDQDVDEEEGLDQTKDDKLDGMMNSGKAWLSSDRDYTYDELLTRVFDIMREKNPDMVAGEKKKFVMRPPQVLRVGTKKSSFANFAEICRMLHRQPKHVLAFLLAELGTSGSVDGNNQLIIKGRFQQKQIENVLRRYIKEYVTCHTCRSPDTILQKDTRLFFLQCETCGSRCSVASIKSGFQAVTGKRAAIRAKTA
ncbi:eukaryotic translation initiation factor 2 subunit 2-like [Liolophura sinensis]|uniref:eukaryotic translation initiation factor 2 subunit 2-like n=1 Tax=Liolophura sinensis TaxID=3198878 RepID=UPI003158F008